MRTSDLIGALLDYWVARAEGVSPDHLEIRNPEHPEDSLCVKKIRKPGPEMYHVLDYSKNWELTGPLMEKHSMGCMEYSEGGWWAARTGKYGYDEKSTRGDTPLIAISRAVVHAAFGDTVEDLL